MKKKSLFSILIISLLVFSHVPNTLAEEKKETIPSSTVNPIVEVKLISDDFIQVQPTAQNGTTWLSILSTVHILH